MTGFSLMCRNDLWQIPEMHYQYRSSVLTTNWRIISMTGNIPIMDSGRFLDIKKKNGVEEVALPVWGSPPPTTLSSSSSSVQLILFHLFWMSRKRITSCCFLQNIVIGHHLQHKCCPPWFVVING